MPRNGMKVALHAAVDDLCWELNGVSLSLLVLSDILAAFDTIDCSNLPSYPCGLKIQRFSNCSILTVLGNSNRREEISPIAIPFWGAMVINLFPLLFHMYMRYLVKGVIPSTG